MATAKILVSFFLAMTMQLQPSNAFSHRRHSRSSDDQVCYGYPDALWNYLQYKLQDIYEGDANLMKQELGYDGTNRETVTTVACRIKSELTIII